jgi:hypothetical protein
MVPWIHGGTTGGQKLKVELIRESTAGPRIEIVPAPQANTWSKVSIALSDLGAAGVQAGRRVLANSTGNAEVLVYTAAGGETSFADPLLISSTVIDVERNGVGLMVVAGSPSVNEVQFNSGTGTLTFNYALGAGEYIQVIYFT